MALQHVARTRRTRQRTTHNRFIQAAEIHYQMKFQWLTRCVYCGLPADTLDHVFPLALAANLDTARPGVRKALGQGLNRVPSCRQCNGIAGAKPFTSIRQKRWYIQDVLRKKLAADLHMPDWDKDELAELGHSMRVHVLQGIRARKRAAMRCNWPAIRSSV